MKPLFSSLSSGRAGRWLFGCALVLLALTGRGGEVPEDVAARIVDTLSEARPDFEYRDVVSTPIDGVYQVRVVNGPLLYVSASGEYFIAGELFHAMPGQFVNLSELTFARERQRLLASLPREDMIIFSPEEPRAAITVFTDVDCGYCRRMHREVDEYLELGIEVRYLAFPRHGMNTPTAEKMISAWCAKDRQEALTRLKDGKSIRNNQCENHPVARQYQAGRELGVGGTPAILLEDGTLVPGYRPAADMVRSLGLE